jgi:hypothetical protein
MSKGSSWREIQATVMTEERGDNIEKLRLNPTTNQAVHKPLEATCEDRQSEAQRDNPDWNEGGMLWTTAHINIC